MKKTIPNPVADYREGGRAGLVFVFGEGPADLRLQTNHIEEIRRHVRDRDAFGFAAGDAAQVPRFKPADREMLERLAVVSPIDVIRQRDRSIDAAADFIEVNDPFRLRIRKRAEKNVVNHAEDRGVRADPEREREDG